jgi:hypothetical protein
MSESSPPTDDPQPLAPDPSIDPIPDAHDPTPRDGPQETPQAVAEPSPSPAQMAVRPLITPSAPYVDTTHRTLEVPIVAPIRAARRPAPRRWIVPVVSIILAIILAVPVGLAIGGINGALLPSAPTPTVPISDIASAATITFTRTSQTLTASPSTVVAATQGGEVPATEVDVSVHQVQSAPVDAPQDPTTHFYMVPSGCGDTSPAYAAAFKGLRFALNSRSPGGSIVFYGPAIGYDPGSLTCYPSAGTASSAPFQFVERLDGSAFHVYYLLIDVQLYQIARIQKHLPANNVILSVRTCSGVPPMSSQTRSSVTITCPTTALTGWDWSQANEQRLLAQIQGMPMAAALQQLNHTPGIVAGSAKIALSNGAALPSDVNAITVQVQG